MHDVAIVGLGPAGRALASHCVDRGLDVLAVDPRPDAVWRPTYGVWEDELSHLPTAVVRHRVAQPELRSRGRHRLDRAYVVLDNAELQRTLPLEGATVERARLTDVEMTGLRGRARVVVDARGARPAGHVPDDPAAAQTAYGVVVPSEVAVPALDGAEALLMDWRTDWSPHPSPGGVPTFLYAIPLGPQEVLLEETCLAAAPGMPVAQLRDRLQHRLRARGVAMDALDEPRSREVVRIPMRGRDAPAPEGTVALGVAGRGGHPVTGYSVASSLARARTLAAQLAAGERPHQVDVAGPADVVRELGLRALLRLDTDGTLELFEAFGRLGPHRQRAFMSRTSGAPELLGAMWQMFSAMPGHGRVELVRATFGAPWEGLRLGR